MFDLDRSGKIEEQLQEEGISQRGRDRAERVRDEGKVNVKAERQYEQGKGYVNVERRYEEGIGERK